MSAFATGQTSLQRAITEWLRQQVAQDLGGVLVARAILIESHPWKQLAEAALINAFIPWRSDQARLLWRWWTEEPAIFTASQILIPKASEQVEEDFTLSLPAAIPSPLRPEVLLLCRGRGWYRLHSALLAADPQLTPIERLRSQLEVQADLNAVAGLQDIARRMTSSELLDAALIIQDARLVGLAGEAVTREPTLLQNIDARSPAWGAIWTSAVEHGHGLFDGIADPSIAAHAVFDALRAGSKIAPLMIEQLSLDPASNLARYPHRKEIWDLLPSPVRARSVEITADEWLMGFLAEHEFDSSTIEPELERAVLTLWRSSPSKVGAAFLVGFWQRFSSGLSESDFQSWLREYQLPLLPLEAVAIGRLIKDKDWIRASEDLAGRAKYDRPDLRPAVTEFWDLLSRWDRIYFSVFTYGPIIREDEWWEAFLELSTRLFPRGVGDNDIWYKADGDVSRVGGETGREEWARALDLLRKGGTGGNMNVEGLLYQMRNLFYSNADLKLLEDVYLKKIRRQY